MATQGKIAVITGAGSGIGRATAHSLLEAGWNVVLAGRRRDMLEETAQLAGMTPPRTLAVPTDIRNPAQIEGLTRSISLDGREYNIACGQIDIGNAATTRNEDTARGRLQASGRVEAEARIDVRDVAKGVLYMAELPPEANVLFMTVMANKMPYVGRG